MKCRTTIFAVSLLICLSFSQLVASYYLKEMNYNQDAPIKLTGLQPQIPMKLKNKGATSTTASPANREEEEKKEKKKLGWNQRKQEENKGEKKKLGWKQRKQEEKKGKKNGKKH